MRDDTQDIDQSAAILCPHIAIHKQPICFARRDEPAFPEDSGWQFLCGADHGEGEPEGHLWSINDVMKLESSLRVFLSCAENTEISRTDSSSEWIVSLDGELHVKIFFGLEIGNSDSSLTSESLWAKKIGSSQYQIDNVPLFVQDVSPGDVVSGQLKHGNMWFSSVITRSASSVIWLITDEHDDDDFNNAKAALEAEGCVVEGTIGRKRFAVEVPADVDLRRILTAIEAHKLHWHVSYTVASWRHPRL